MGGWVWGGTGGSKEWSHQIGMVSCTSRIFVVLAPSPNMMLWEVFYTQVGRWWRIGGRGGVHKYFGGVYFYLVFNYFQWGNFL